MFDKPSYKIKWYYQLVVQLVIAVFKRVFKITATIPSEIRDINEPYLLLSNHVGRYDPFIVSDFIRKKPNFISSDAILRDSIIGRIFKGLGAIPKKKGVRDTHVIREMVKVIQQGGAIALFPEATRTWSGENLYIDPSIAKLVRLLKVPVIIAKMKGAYAFDPRWARPLRRAKVEIDYSFAITKQQLASLEDDQIMNIIYKSLAHDDIAYLRENKVLIKSNCKAEYIERILFQCPECKSFEGFSSTRNHFGCNICGYHLEVDNYGFFKKNGHSVPLDNPKDWLDWQNKNFVNWVSDNLKNTAESFLFKAVDMNIQVAEGQGKMIDKGLGYIAFYSDRIKIVSQKGEEDLLHSETTSLSPQFKERIEILYHDKAYRFTSIQYQEAGIKWELAINAVWYATGQQFKLSPYFKHLFEE